MVKSESVVKVHVLQQSGVYPDPLPPAPCDSKMVSTLLFAYSAWGGSRTLNVGSKFVHPRLATQFTRSSPPALHQVRRTSPFPARSMPRSQFVCATPPSYLFVLIGYLYPSSLDIKGIRTFFEGNLYVGPRNSRSIARFPLISRDDGYRTHDFLILVACAKQYRVEGRYG